MLYLHPIIGGLAHLARALAWQARGGRFESDILHGLIRITKHPSESYGSEGFFILLPTELITAVKVHFKE
jgi:hypothetical protein